MPILWATLYAIKLYTALIAAELYCFLSASAMPEQTIKFALKLAIFTARTLPRLTLHFAHRPRHGSSQTVDRRQTPRRSYGYALYMHRAAIIAFATI